AHIGVFCAESLSDLHAALLEQLPGVGCECLAMSCGDAVLFDGQFLQLEREHGWTETNIESPTLLTSEAQGRELSAQFDVPADSVEQILTAHLDQCETGLEISQSLFHRLQVPASAWERLGDRVPGPDVQTEGRGSQRLRSGDY